MTLLHLAWASAVTFGERVELLPERRSAKLSLGQRTVTHGQLYITAKTLLHARNLLHFSCSCSSCLFFFLLSLLTSLHPPHHLSCIRWDRVWSFSLLSLRQGIVSVRGLVHVRWRPMPETCGVFKPAGPPISPTSNPVAALKWGPSAECPCVCLPNPHKDLSLCHKFI